MTLKERVGLNFPPVLLRLLLATLFLWAGLGKVLSHTEVDGPAAATLANMGIVDAPVPAAPDRSYTAADFPEPISVLRVYGLALRIHNASHPAPATASAEGGDNAAPMVYWPPALGEGAWPVSLAWAVAFTEIVGGICLLMGLLTRFWAVGIAGVMLGAIWLTQLGPAIQSGETVLGFLPAHPRFSPPEWQPLMFQFSLLMAALALAFLGPGRTSVDHALFGPARDDDDYDDDDDED